MTAPLTHAAQVATARLDLHVPELRILPWPDSTVERIGFPLRHPYVEAFCPSFLGPTAVLLLRRLGLGLAVHPDGYTVDLAALGGALGLGPSRGRNSALHRTINRLGYYGLAEPREPGQLAVRTHVAPLSASLARKLPPMLQAEHAYALVQRAAP